MSRPHPYPMPPELRQALGLGPDAEPLARIWAALGEAPPPRPEVPDDATALSELERRLDHPPRPPRLNPDRPVLASPAAAPRPALGARRVARWGALALLVVALAAGAWAWRQPVTATAAPGELLALRLPDGTAVTLNSGSTLRFARGFDAWPFVPAAVREVRLDGEAYFEVVHTGRPFVVETFDARVEVLGTAFSVRAHRVAGGDGTRVTLATGRVRVRAGGDAVVLAGAGASARVAGGAHERIQVTTLPLPRALAWRSEGFSAVDEPLPAILSEIERRFAVEVDVRGEVPTGALNLFYPQGATAEQSLHDVCLARGCRFWRTSRGFALRME